MAWYVAVGLLLMFACKVGWNFGLRTKLDELEDLHRRTLACKEREVAALRESRSLWIEKSCYLPSNN